MTTDYVKAEDRKQWPLTFAERQMVTEQMLHPESTEYNINLSALRLRGPLDEERLRKALSEVVRRHRVLRSRYMLQNGEFVREIDENAEIPLEVYNSTPEEVKKRIEELNQPFDLAAGPLVRAHLFRHGDEDHTLHFTFHHVIMDAGGMPPFYRDLLALYDGKNPAPPAFDYLDHAVWQSEQDAADGQLFRDMFKDGVPETEMPTHPVRPPELPPADAVLTAEIPSGPLKDAARRFGVTRYELLMAALGMTLAKYTGGEDVVVGTAMTTRTGPENQDMIGMFVNTLPVRLQPAGDKSVGEAVREAAATVGDVKHNRTFPFEQLVPELAPDRNASRSPVFDVMFNYLQPDPEYTSDTLAVESLQFARQTLAYDFVLEVLGRGDVFELQLRYSPDLYDQEVAENFLAQFTTVLSRLKTAAPEDLVMDVAELPEDQKQHLLKDFAGPRQETDPRATIVSMFREQAKKTPDKTAAVYGDEKITYAELDDVTDRLAAHLASSGLGRGKRAGVMVERGLMMPIGALGVLKTGAAYLPMDPAYPAERLEYMLGDAEAELIVADEALRDKVPGYTGEWFFTKDIQDLPAAENVPEGPHPEDLFILLYTSGTTGQPKGVMLLHRNLVNFVQYYMRTRSLDETDKVAAYASFGFDAAMMDMYPTLLSGAELHIIPESMRLDLPGIREYFAENGVTVAFMTTQLGRQFAEGAAHPGFRMISVGGEALVPMAPPKDFELRNLYGPTECTVYVTEHVVDKKDDRVPIGAPVDNTDLYILDPRGRLAPVGVAGELAIGGRSVSAGYLHRPDLTEEKFVPNPFSTEEGFDRIYKTGDVARWLPSGEIDFVGRRDMQVKIRGFRVELTEIEERIRAFPGIRDAAVVAQDDAGGGKRIVAYIVSDAPVDVGALSAFIAEKLPPYMVPAATMQIDSIPLNQNGKVDRRRLPKIQIQAEEIIQPRTDLEKQIFAAVAEILGHEEFGVTTDLLYAGLNSLSSIRATALITEKTGRTLSTTDLMRDKTIEKIARRLQEGPAYMAREFEVRDQYPLTENQLGVYFALVKDPGTLVYNIPFAIALSRDIDADRLEESFRKVINAHPYVKTHLRLEGSTPMQVRNDEAEVQIARASGTEEEAQKRRQTFARPFDFFAGPLYRAEILETPEHTYLLADFHHLIFDGGSLDILLRDLQKAYAGEELTPERYTSFDLAAEAEERRQSGETGRAKEFFAAKIGDGDGATQISTDRTGSGGNPQTVRARVPKAGIESALRELGVTPANLFLAATALTTGRYASTDDVRFASINNGRDGLDVQSNLGMLVETMPVVVHTDAGQNVRDYLTDTQNGMLEILENKAYPYLRAASDFGYQTQILYAYQGGVISDHKIGGEPVQPEMLSIDHAKFPISVNVQEDDTSYIVEAEFDDAMFDASTIQNFADAAAGAARLLVASQDKTLGELGIETDAQAAQVASFDKPPADLPFPSLNRVFESWAEKTPDASALTAGSENLSFRELNERANRLAHALMAKGVQRGDRVAFMLPRDSRILTSMLGILKTGASYIPVDPEYPEERIRHVLEDSGARFLLTDRPEGLDQALDFDALLASSDDVSNPDVDIQPDDLCYIIYTSGSTGRPKGVMIEHHNIMNYVADVPANVHVQALTKNKADMVSVTTVSFDMFLKEAFTTLMNGRRLILADDEESKNPAQLARLFARSGGTAFNATPSRMLQYMNLPEMRDALRQCRVVMAGGEAYPAALYKKLRETTDATLINTYGPTEITVSSNAKILEDDHISVGAPLSGTRERIMDITGHPLPVGALGELWIGGSGVGRGYFGNPEMTAQQFVEKDGTRWYKSGDLAKWTPAGDVRILGRNDGQIKLRGLRIELGEIEKALQEIPGVESSAVLVTKLHGQEHLSAYYTADRELRPETVRDELARTLTRYMVPTAYLQMDALPMTPNGKIDRRALPEPQLMRREEYAAPTNEREQIYADIFADILGIDRVSIDDSFFDLGGTSLLVTQVTIDAAARGLEISYGDVFANPTPRELAALDAATAVRGGDDVGDYDYEPLHTLLEDNTIDALVKGDLRDLGNVCISGATGFLGIHVLREFLSSEKGAAYCLVRAGSQERAVARLRSLLVYYFSDSFDDLFGSRIIVVPGDVTDPETFRLLDHYPIDTFINCAANVKHFSAGTDIEDVNVGGARNAIDFCERKGCRFIQISTASTAGMRVDGSVEADVVMNEQMLYFGQDLANKYTNSKFLAERMTLEAARNGLDAKIMRVGNLMARDEDGEFQANFRTNNFLNRLKAYSIIGKIPYEALGADTEFAPIDYTARAILALAKTPKENRVFHPYNDHSVYFGDIVAALDDLGIHIEPTEKEEYMEAYADAMHDKRKARYLNSLIAYQESGRDVEVIRSSNAYTQQALLRLGFRWPITTPEYMRSFFQMMEELGVFDQDL